MPEESVHLSRSDWRDIVVVLTVALDQDFVKDEEVEMKLVELIESIKEQVGGGQVTRL